MLISLVITGGPKPGIYLLSGLFQKPLLIPGLTTPPHFGVNKFVKFISEKNVTEPWRGEVPGGGVGCSTQTQQIFIKMRVAGLEPRVLASALPICDLKQDTSALCALVSSAAY